MEALWDSPWRVLPALELMAVGAAMAAAGMCSGWRFLHSAFGTTGRNLTLMRGMRFFLAGAALVAIGAGWLWHLPILIAAGAIIGFEETIETSIAAHALADEARRHAQEASHG